MEAYQNTLRGLCPTLKSEDVEHAVHNWEEFMKLMRLDGDEADKLFVKVIKDRLQDGILSIASPNAEEIEFYAFVYGRNCE